MAKTQQRMGACLTFCVVLMVNWAGGSSWAAAQAQASHPSQSAAAIEPDFMLDLWPGEVPGAPERLPQESMVQRDNPFGLVDRAVHNVRRPNLSVFTPKRPNGAAILIIPGGGYSWVVVDKEGYEGGKHFSEAGFQVYVLRYRLPHQGWAAGPDTPLQDAQRAMRIIRARASQDRVDPTKIMVMGFSAGGHVAGSLALKFDQATQKSIDDIDKLSAKPDLAVLMYPVVTMTAAFAHPKSRDNLIGIAPTPAAIAAYSLEQNVRPDAPPLFILHASDDRAVPVDNALMLAQSARAQAVPTSLHVFETGGHGFGLRGIAGSPLAVWPKLVLDWAAAHGFPAVASQR